MNKIKSLRSSPLALFGLTALCLASFLIFTDPLQLPLALLLMPFILFFICIRSLLLALMKRFSTDTSKRKIRLLAGGLAFILLFILVLQSLGQLSWRDVLLTGSLVAAVVFYFSKTDLL